MSENGYIAVDLDGTLAFWEGWVQWDSIGEPIPLMAERVRGWLAEGKKVKIFTARLNPKGEMLCECKTSGEMFDNSDMREVVQNWTEKHFGVRLEVTNVKGWDMIEFWDDRAIGVERNTGRTLVDAAIAEAQAKKGAP